MTNTRKDIYEVRHNTCNCHPETCACNDWAIYKNDEKYTSFFYKEEAEALVDYLNLK